jgi:hypothetical protein
MLEEEVYEGRSRWQMYEHMPVYGTENTQRDVADDSTLAKCPELDVTLLRKILVKLKPI